MATKNDMQDNRSNIESLKKASLAIEDLLLIIQRIRPEQLKSAINTLNFIVMDSKSQVHSVVAKTYQSIDPNKHFLIGTLPRLLLDRDLFPSNEEITKFAEETLNFKIAQAEKRSRHEIIGKIVCETDKLDEKQLTYLVKALELIVGNKDKLAILIEKKKSGAFSWNETLQDILKT